MKLMSVTLAILSLTAPTSAGALSNPIPRADRMLFDLYYDIRPMCRIGEDADGPISAKEYEFACDQLNALGTIIRAYDYCWYRVEQVWVRCSQICRTEPCKPPAIKH